MRAAGWAVVTGAVALAIGAGAHGATPEARADYKATMKQATADYNAARSHCRTLSGHPRSVCIAEAKATLRKAEANAEAAYRDSARARLDAELNGARADYSVDKAKCGDRSGAARKSCIAAARARQSETITRAVKTSKAAAQSKTPTPAAPARAPAASAPAPAAPASAPTAPAAAPAPSTPAATAPPKTP